MIEAVLGNVFGYLSKLKWRFLYIYECTYYIVHFQIYNMNYERTRKSHHDVICGVSNSAM